MGMHFQKSVEVSCVLGTCSYDGQTHDKFDNTGDERSTTLAFFWGAICFCPLTSHYFIHFVLPRKAFGTIPVFENFLPPVLLDVSLG